MRELMIRRFTLVKTPSKNTKTKPKWILKVCTDHYRKPIILACHVVNENQYNQILKMFLDYHKSVLTT